MFPERNWLGMAKGWEDVGERNGTYNAEKEGTEYVTHAFCQTKTRVGKEDGQLFLFCPMCEVKVQYNSQGEK